MWFPHFTLILITCSCVFSEECYTHDFGEDFNDEFTSQSGVCGAMTSWIQIDYSSTNIESFHPNSVSFITPQTTYSCITSEVFPMAGGGTLQLNVYMFPSSSMDQIRLLAYRASTNTIVGQITRSLSLPNFTWGWSTMNLTLGGNDNFDGYVALVGRKQSNSDILVDSLRYLPSEIEADEDACPIYVEGKVYACIEYDFENDFETLFNNIYFICPNFAKWEIVNYGLGSSISPNSDGSFSCTSSLFFKMEANGTLELNVIGLSMSNEDFISLLVVDEQNVSSNEETYYTPSNTDIFVPGAHTLKIPIEVNEPKNVQIVFMGVSKDESIVLIQSFKFTPSPHDGKDCVQFKDVVIDN